MRRVILLVLLMGLSLGCSLQARRTPPPQAAEPPAVDHRVSESRRPRPPQMVAQDLSAAFPGVLFLEGPRSASAVALTFDDGPDNYYTPRILAVLQQMGVRATFFLLGEHVAQFPDVARQLAAAGMVIGNHTWDHPELTKLSPDAVRGELERTDAELRTAVGSGTRLMRPPYGDLNVDVMRQLQGMGYDVVFWTDDSLDWRGLSARQVEANVLAHVRRGDIVLQHSYSGGRRENLTGTVEALPHIIEALHREGLQVVTIPELLGIADWRA